MTHRVFDAHDPHEWTRRASATGKLDMEDTDTLHGHYQPTNHISEEVLDFIRAWEETFSNQTYFLEPFGSDFNLPADLSQPPRRYRRKSKSPKKKVQMN